MTPYEFNLKLLEIQKLFEDAAYDKTLEELETLAMHLRTENKYRRQYLDEFIRDI